MRATSWIPALLLGTASHGAGVGQARDEPPRQRVVIINCTQQPGAAVRQAQFCAETSDAITPVGRQDGRPGRIFRDLDGSSVEEFIYRIPRTLSFQASFCAPDLLSVRPHSLSADPLLWRRETGAAGCALLRISSFAGLLAIAVRTRGANSALTLNIVEAAPLPPPPMTPVVPIPPPAMVPPPMH